MDNHHDEEVALKVWTWLELEVWTEGSEFAEFLPSFCLFQPILFIPHSTVCIEVLLGTRHCSQQRTRERGRQRICAEVLTSWQRRQTTKQGNKQCQTSSRNKGLRVSEAGWGRRSDGVWGRWLFQSLQPATCSLRKGCGPCGVGNASGNAGPGGGNLKSEDLEASGGSGGGWGWGEGTRVRGR